MFYSFLIYRLIKSILTMLFGETQRIIESVAEGMIEGSDAVQRAARNDSKHIVSALLMRGIGRPEDVIQGAAEGHRMDLLEEYIMTCHKKGTESIPYMITNAAALGGHLDIIKKYADILTCDWTTIIGNAAQNNRVSVVEYVIEYIQKNKQLSKNFYRTIGFAIQKAAHHKAEDVLQCLFNVKFPDIQVEQWPIGKVSMRTYLLNHGLMGAAASGDLEMMDEFMEQGANSLANALFAAASNVAFSSLEYIVELNRRLESGEVIRTEQGVKLRMKLLTTEDFNNALGTVSMSHSSEVIHFLVQHGANNFEECIRLQKIIYGDSDHKDSSVVKTLQMVIDERRKGEEEVQAIIESINKMDNQIEVKAIIESSTTTSNTTSSQTSLDDNFFKDL